MFIINPEHHAELVREERELREALAAIGEHDSVIIRAARNHLRSLEQYFELLHSESGHGNLNNLTARW